MRSSKSRSRNKSNRSSSNNNNRSAVNLVNRVFDSSGPDGKVRGTPQQIIDKYTQLARDAQLSNDRVAAENFQQHAEHYLRMLGEAQREIDARRDQEQAQQAQRDRQQQQQQNNNNSNQGGQPQNSQPGGGDQPQPQSQPQPQQPEAPVEAASPEAKPVEKPEAKPESQPRIRRPRTPRAEQPAREDSTSGDVIETHQDGDEASGLVETPESKPSKPRRPRSKPRPKSDAADDQSSGKSEAAE